MALNDISYELGQGGLGRPLPGEDYISGLIFYTAGNLPSGFSSSNRIKPFLSVAEAEAAGILDDYSDETLSAATIQITTAGTNGDIATVVVTDPFDGLLTLGSYTKASGQSTASAVAAAINTAINANTATTGYFSTVSTDTVTIKPPAGRGIALQTGTPLALNLSNGATLAGTVTQFANGAASKQAVWHYHISEYFRKQPQGKVWVGIYAVPNPYTFSEMISVQNAALGKIRQFGIYKDSAAFSTADITTIHNQCATMVAAHKECIAIYTADISGTTDLSTLANTRALTANYCSPDIAQDGAALGARLFTMTGKTIGTLGALLGSVSLSAVNESIAWPAKFNISDGTECDTPAFGNGKLLTDGSITDNLLTQLQNYGYIFFRKFIGVDGTYYNENSSCISKTSDYAYINDNRTIQKATRNIYAVMVPLLNSPLTLNSDGTLADYTCESFTTTVEGPLAQMKRNGELSSYSVAINPSQNVLGTNKVVLTVSLVPAGVARNILINIGYNVKIN